MRERCERENARDSFNCARYPSVHNAWTARTPHANANATRQTPIRMQSLPRCAVSNAKSNNKPGYPKKLATPPPRLDLRPLLSIRTSCLNIRLYWDPKPTPSISSHSEAPTRSRSIKIPLWAALLSRSRRLHSVRRLLLKLPILLHKLASNDSKDLLHALPTLSTNLMAAIPSHLLTPESATPLRTRTSCAIQRGSLAAPLSQESAMSTSPATGIRSATGCSSCWWGRGHAGREVVCYVGDAAFERYLPQRRVTGNEICLRANDVEDDI